MSEARDQADTELSYCRQCGGDRSHTVVARHGSDKPAPPAPGSDTWSILECRGCGTVTFVHAHWFSGGDGPVVHRDLYPPSPRPLPEWASWLWLVLTFEGQWVDKLHRDIYAALGIGALSLAAMGVRAIVEFVVTSKVGDIGGFARKLGRMRDDGLISDAQAERLNAVFDAGSAAAHRGYRPTRKDVYALLDITEDLLRQMYIDPMRERFRVEAADALEAKTPLRVRPKHR